MALSCATLTQHQVWSPTCCQAAFAEMLHARGRHGHRTLSGTAGLLVLRGLCALAQKSVPVGCTRRRSCCKAGVWQHWEGRVRACVGRARRALGGGQSFLCCLKDLPQDDLHRRNGHWRQETIKSHVRMWKPTLGPLTFGVVLQSTISTIWCGQPGPFSERDEPVIKAE